MINIELHTICQEYNCLKIRRLTHYLHTKIVRKRTVFARFRTVYYSENLNFLPFKLRNKGYQTALNLH
jgi:hypothetical protein